MTPAPPDEDDAPEALPEALPEAVPWAVLEIVVEDARWDAAGLAPVAEAAAQAVLAAAGRAPLRHEVSLLACDDARIAALNASFRGRQTPTNVLSWPAFDGPTPQPGAEPDAGPDAGLDAARLFLGDLALAYETCAREALAAGIPLGHHAAHLVAHGILHLLGHDHAGDAAAEAMEAIETKALASLGIADPYLR